MPLTSIMATSVDDPEFMRQLDRYVEVRLVLLRLVQVVALLVDLDDRAVLVALEHRAAERIAVGQAAGEGVAAMRGGGFVLVVLAALKTQPRPGARGVHEERRFPVRHPNLRRWPSIASP